MYVFSFLLFGCVSIVPAENVYVTAVVLISVFVIFSKAATKIPEWFVMKNNVSRVASQIIIDDKAYDLTLVCDSGNLLTDPYTKLPVVIIRHNFSEYIDIHKLKRWPVPFKTISGVGVIYVVSPKKIRVLLRGKWHNVNAVIGLCENISDGISGADGIIPTRLLENL